MLSYNIKDYEINPSGGQLIEISGSCLSTDEKPTEGIVNGSSLIEMDTGTVYMFDAENSQWVAFG